MQLLSHSTRTVFHGGKTRSDDSSRDFHGEPTGCSQKETPHTRSFHSRSSRIFLSRKKTMTRERLTRLVYAPSLIAEFLQMRNGCDPLCRWQPRKKRRGSSPTFLFLRRSRVAHATFCSWSLIGEGKSDRMLLTEGVRTLCTFDDEVIW